MAPGAARSVMGGAAAAGRSASALAGGARSAYQAGAAASGGSGLRAAGAGLANVARSGAGAVGDRMAAGAKAMRDRVENFVAEAAAPPSAAATVSAAPAEAPAASVTPPAWAQRLQRHQRLAHGATVAAHTLRSGDSGGSGASPGLRDDS
jgi:type IV secretion system protein TrbL